MLSAIGAPEPHIGIGADEIEYIKVMKFIPLVNRVDPRLKTYLGGLRLPLIRLIARLSLCKRSSPGLPLLFRAGQSKH